MNRHMLAMTKNLTKNSCSDKMNEKKERLFGGESMTAQEKWDANMALKKYYEDKMGKDIYTVVEKETFSP